VKPTAGHRSGSPGDPGVITAVRLWLFGTARIEAILAVVATVVLVAWQAFVGLQAAGLVIDPSCLLIVAETCDFEAVVRRRALFADELILELAGLGIAIGIGTLLGTTAIASEIESGTIQTAWWLDRRRSRWFLTRVLALGGLALALALVLAVVSHWFQSVRQPYFDPGASFDSYRFRGAVLLGVGLGAFGVSLFFGSLVGRTLPAIVLAVATTLVLVGLAHVVAFPNLAERVLLDLDPRASAWPHQGLETRYEAPDGTILTLDMARAASPVDPAKQEFWDWLSATFRPVPFGYPGSFYWAVALRELGLWVGSSAAFTAAAWLVVRRRRPT
jgi:hypothetical protein